MKILQLTPGTGNFHCGGCLRDNALVKALRTMGHAATMIPLYLPAVTDGPAVCDGQPILFGGINVYLQQHLALFRKTPCWMDRWFDVPTLLRWASGRAGMTGARQLGELTLSMLHGEEGRQRKELQKLIAWVRAHEKPDVVSLSNALLVGLARKIKTELAVPVVCTLQGEDAFLDTLPQPQSTQAWQTLLDRARDVDAFIPCSRYYADVMTRRLDLPANRVHVVHNGIELNGFGPPPPSPQPPAVGYLARMCHAKGLDTLAAAFVILKQRGRIEQLKLQVIGACTIADQPFVNQVKQRLADARVLQDVTFYPNVSFDRKVELLHTLSVLSVPATYGEAFGLYVLEALAAGVPVVQPNHGAFPELLGRAGGGILCEPDDPQSLADGLESILLRPDRRAFGLQGRAEVLQNFSVERMAQEVLQVFQQSLYNSSESEDLCNAAELQDRCN